MTSRFNFNILDCNKSIEEYTGGDDQSWILPVN